MTLKPAPEVAVIASTPVPWLIGGMSDGLVSLGLGLLAVLLARTIFVSRENRALGRRQPMRETLPVTLAACLIASGIIYDKHLLYSNAIFTGIAVGWTTIVLIDKISLIVNPGMAARAIAPPTSPALDPVLDTVRAKPLPASHPDHLALLQSLDNEEPSEG